MSSANASSLAFSSLGDEFCWHARNFAAMYAADFIESVHILLAAAEVTPIEMHGYDELTPQSISSGLAALYVENASQGTRDLVLPKKLSPQAQELVATATTFALQTDRAMTLRDVWVALSQEEEGVAALVLEHLGIDRRELYRRVSGA